MTTFIKPCDWTASIHHSSYLLTREIVLNYVKTFQFSSLRGGFLMLKSPCINCDRANEDKNKCLENCEKLREYQEMILKQGIYATM
jgi:hypothetical protein